MSINTNFTHQEYMLSRYIGKPVIILSNEIENLTVAIGLEIVHSSFSQQPLLKCYDVVRKTEIVPMGVVFAYTEQKFKSLLNIEANDRIALFFNKESFSLVDKTKTKIEDIESPEIWSSKVYLGLESTHELQTQLLEQKNINKKNKLVK